MFQTDGVPNLVKKFRPDAANCNYFGFMPQLSGIITSSVAARGLDAVIIIS